MWSRRRWFQWCFYSYFYSTTSTELVRVMVGLQAAAGFFDVARGVCGVVLRPGHYSGAAARRADTARAVRACDPAVRACFKSLRSKLRIYSLVLAKTFLDWMVRLQKIKIK